MYQVITRDSQSMSRQAFFKSILLLFNTFILASCANNTISTNLDKENFNDYFSASKVTIYKSVKDIKTSYQFIGGVEGQDCQIKPHHAAPDEVNARTQARKQAFALPANGIIFTGCALLTHEQLVQLNNSNDAQQCHSLIICYAKAYAIETE